MGWGVPLKLSLQTMLVELHCPIPGCTGHRLHADDAYMPGGGGGGGGVAGLNGDAHDMSSLMSNDSPGTSISKSTSGDDMPHALSKVSTTRGHARKHARL